LCHTSNPVSDKGIRPTLGGRQRARRLHNHLVTGQFSNIALQQAIATNGLQHFTAYILEVVKIPSGLTPKEQKTFLRSVEQKHINRFPKAQLYNSINATKD
jgi:hypothetical protein